jgi:hypothetical protein
MVMFKSVRPTTHPHLLEEMALYMSDHRPEVYIKDGKVAVLVEKTVVIFGPEKTQLSEVVDLVDELFHHREDGYYQS